MLELKVSGKDVGELYQNAMNCFLLLTQGGNKLFTPAAPAATPVTETAPSTDVPEAVPEANPPAVTKPKRTRQNKPPETIEATATEVTDSPATEDDPLGLSNAAPTETPKELTLDDMRERVKAIIKAHTEDRGNKMPDAIAYVRKLFAPFGIKLAAELKPEQFNKFWQDSEAYLDGTAK